MDIKTVLSYVDHTLLSQTATWDEIRAICDDGIRYSCASVCIPPSYVKKASEYVDGKISICTVIGFPNGYNTTKAKCFEAYDAVENGADEIDMVINIGMLKDKRYDELLYEISEVKKACKDKLLKVIIETCLLTEEEKVIMCKIVSESGADFIKTSTGKISISATPEAAYVMCKAIKEYKAQTGKWVGFKAAGGIKTVEDALAYYTIVREVLGQEFIDKNLFRIGTSSLANQLVNSILGEVVNPF